MMFCLHLHNGVTGMTNILPSDDIRHLRQKTFYSKITGLKRFIFHSILPFHFVTKSVPQKAALVVSLHR
jgi:hypothetical protein